MEGVGCLIAALDCRMICTKGSCSAKCGLIVNTFNNVAFNFKSVLVCVCVCARARERTRAFGTPSLTTRTVR